MRGFGKRIASDVTTAIIIAPLPEVQPVQPEKRSQNAGVVRQKLTIA